VRAGWGKAAARNDSQKQWPAIADCILKHSLFFLCLRSVVQPHPIFVAAPFGLKLVPLGTIRRRRLTRGRVVPNNPRPLSLPARIPERSEGPRGKVFIRAASASLSTISAESVHFRRKTGLKLLTHARKWLIIEHYVSQHPFHIGKSRRLCLTVCK